MSVHGATPQWLWGTHEKNGACTLNRKFELDDTVAAASLKLAADFCQATVVINGRTVLTVEPYAPTHELDVTPWLQRGTNELSVRARRVAGPSAFAMSLDVAYGPSRSTTISSDGEWTDAAVLGTVLPELWGVGRRSATVSPLENYQQWRQSLPATAREARLWAADGFEISLVRAAAADEGSWISLAFDPQGRATVSREDRGLLRMTLTADGRSVTRVEPIDVDLRECRGLAYAFDRLYANANNSKAMFWLQVDEQGRPDEPHKLHDFPGNVGHGRNDLLLGTDGKLYSMHGDSVWIPESPVVDRTSPWRAPASQSPRREGHLLQTDRDGRHWEMLCAGLRNPYGVAMNSAGDLFTYDADNEFDMGTPWYRPTRIVQLVSGGDFGYRDVSGKWPPRFADRPDNALPTIDVGRGSPTALMFGTSLNFPAPYREALFVLDWAYGRVLAVHLAPRGAGYRAALEMFLQGRPLNVTDLAAGPDGALYLITGGRKTQSALYRVAFKGTKDPPPGENTHEREAARFSSTQRTTRRQLEAFHGQADRRALETAGPFVADADPTLRHAARIAIEHLPPDAWRTWAETTPPQNAAAVRSLLARATVLARTGDPHACAALVPRLLSIAPEAMDLTDQFTLAHVYGLCHEHARQHVVAEREAIVRQLVACWPDEATQGRWVSVCGTSVELRRRVARLLAELGDAKIVPRVVGTLLTSPVQEDRMQGLFVLRDQREGWSDEARRAYFLALRDGARFVGGEGMPKFLDHLRNNALATLTPAQREALADVLHPSPGVADEPLPAPRPKLRAWKLNDLESLWASDLPPGDASRGASVFRAALCSRCHRAGLEGPAVGPDLTHVARRFSRRDMLDSMLTPSRVVAENYRNVQIVTESGKVHVGRLVATGDFRSETLQLSVDALRPAEIVEIDKRDVAESHVMNTSPMPEGLLDSFTREEIADLLAFLERGLATP